MSLHGFMLDFKKIPQSMVLQSFIIDYPASSPMTLCTNLESKQTEQDAATQIPSAQPFLSSPHKNFPTWNPKIHIPAQQRRHKHNASKECQSTSFCPLDLKLENTHEDQKMLRQNRLCLCLASTLHTTDWKHPTSSRSKLGYRLASRGLQWDDMGMTALSLISY